METQMQQENLSNPLSAIDKALAEAKRRKTMSLSAEVGEKKTDKVKQTAEMKTAVMTAKAIERAASQALIKAHRLERKLAKAIVPQRTPHVKKLATAATKLPQLGMESQTTFNDVTSRFQKEQLSALALHIQHFNRVQATERALSTKLKAGMSVRIIAGPNKYIGMKAVVTKSQRIRCFVEILGFNKQVYLFTSDVEPVQSVTNE